MPRFFYSCEIGKKKDKKAALRDLKNRLSGESTEAVLYVQEGLSRHLRPPTEHRTSQGSVSLRPSGSSSIPQEGQDVEKETFEPIKIKTPNLDKLKKGR